MHDFKLEELLLLSRSERRARKVQFHPKTTVIRGENDTGKSSIIKSLLFTFGATPMQVDERWKTAGVSSLVKFTVDGASYSLYRHADSFSLFSSKNAHLGTFNSITNELAPELAELFNFGLMLQEHGGETKIATPAFFLLPFYIDQDGGWVDNWNSFSGLAQFKQWRRDCVYYHTGIRPNEWYQLKARTRTVLAQLEDPLRQERMLRELMHRIDARMVGAVFDIDVRHYKAQIDRLLRRCDELRTLEENYKARLVDLETDRIRIEAQIEIVSRARKELGLDYEFTNGTTEGHIACPTCGAAYENSFAERFEIAQDEDRCVELLQQLQKESREITQKTKDHRDSLSDTSKEMNEVQTLLAERQGVVTLQTLIEAQGKREVNIVIQDDLKNTIDKINKLQEEQRIAEEEIKKLDDPDRRNRIVGDYRARLHEYLEALSVATSGNALYRRIDSKVNESGSDKPRALLAYFLAILQVIQKHGNYQSFPIIIDAPNQQEQDDPNFDRMLHVIRDRRPAGSQLILGLVYDQGIDFGGSVVEMSDKYHALNSEFYSEIEAELRPYAAANILTH